MFLQDELKGVDTLDYANKLKEITMEDVDRIRKEIFKEDKAILSVVKSK